MRDKVRIRKRGQCSWRKRNNDGTQQKYDRSGQQRKEEGGRFLFPNIKSNNKRWKNILQAPLSQGKTIIKIECNNLIGKVTNQSLILSNPSTQSSLNN